MSSRKSCIAVLIGAAWPDNDASGPVQSVRAIAQLLADNYRFEFFARSGPPNRAPLVPHGTRREMSWGGITYCDIGLSGARDLASMLRGLSADALWLNSVWDREFTLPTLIARRLGHLPKKPLLLSTRGEFSAGALAIKSRSKAMMRQLVRRVDLLGGVTLHVTGAIEAADVARNFPGKAIREMGNVRALDLLPQHIASADNRLRLLFLGRISPVKGLHNALASLSGVETPARLTIHGPVHDVGYWAKCRDQIQSLPDYIQVDVLGPIANADAHRAYSAHDLFLNPSASENFGHTIFESLQAGTPVLTGLATPWNDLERDSAGFNIASGDVQAIAAAIDRFASLRHDRWRRGARRRAEKFVENQSALQAWTAWFAEATNPSLSRSHLKTPNEH